MTNEQQEKLKALAEEEYNSRLAQGSAAGQTFGHVNYEQQQVPQIAEPSLRERIRGKRIHAQSQSRRLEQLHELEYLLDKHPEFARILELIDAVRL